MKFTATEKEMKEKVKINKKKILDILYISCQGGIIKGINIFVPEQHQQNCSSMEATFTVKRGNN
jgi:hypothetical protein